MPELHKVSPFELTIIDEPGHDLHDSRAGLPVDRHLVFSINQTGFWPECPILYKETADGKVVIKGKQRCKASMQVAKMNGAEDTFKVWALKYSGNNADAVMGDALSNLAVVKFTASQQAEKVAQLIRLGFDKATVAKFFKLKVKMIDLYLKYVGVSQLTKNAVETGEKLTYKDPKTGEEKVTKDYYTITVSDIINGQVWLLNEDEQVKWVRKQFNYKARDFARKMAKALKEKGVELDPKNVVDDYPPRYGTKSFKVKALEKFCSAFTLSPPYDSDSPFTEEVETHVKVVQENELLGDGFALGIEFAIGKMMMIFDSGCTPEKLQEATGLDMTEQQIAAFCELWKVSQK